MDGMQVLGLRPKGGPAFRYGNESLAKGGQFQCPVPFVADEQNRVQFLFQHAEAMAEGGLGHVKGTGCLGQVPPLHYGKEYVDVLLGHDEVSFDMVRESGKSTGTISILSYLLDL